MAVVRSAGAGYHHGARTCFNQTRTVNIRTFQPGDEVTQAAVFNVAAFALPGFKPAAADEVKRRTRGRIFDPASRFYAEENGEVVGYCVLEPEQGRVSYPWCKPGHEAAAPMLFEAALESARNRGLTRLFAAYRRDWEPVLRFFTDNGFSVTREMINYWADPVDLPTRASRSRLPIDRLRREDIPALAAMGTGVIRLPADKLEAYCFANPYFPAEAFLVLRDRDGSTPLAVAIGLESGNYADVTKIDPLAPCFRLGAFGTEGLNTKRVNGLFSYVVADPAHSLTAGLALLHEASQEMTEGRCRTGRRSRPRSGPSSGLSAWASRSLNSFRFASRMSAIRCSIVSSVRNRVTSPGASGRCGGPG
jgi:ribosomal protein S18 acetylase RimI-like enzyme